MSALSVSAKCSEMGSSRVRSSWTVSITGSKGLAAGHCIKSHTRYSGSSGDGSFFLLWSTQVTMSFFQLYMEELELDNGKHLPRKDTRFLLHPQGGPAYAGQSQSSTFDCNYNKTTTLRWTKICFLKTVLT